MSAAEVLAQLRWFLLVLSILLFVGALIELWLVGHTEDLIQWLPFGLSIAGIVMVLWVLFRPARRSVRALRVCMVLIALGSLFGIYEHITGNIAFERELQPNASTTQLVAKGLQGGNPLLAPGVLAVAAVLALSATYRYEITTDVRSDLN
jgi:hypothetical protein